MRSEGWRGLRGGAIRRSENDDIRPALGDLFWRERLENAFVLIFRRHIGDRAAGELAAHRISEHQFRVAGDQPNEFAARMAAGAHKTHKKRRAHDASSPIKEAGMAATRSAMREIRAQSFSPFQNTVQGPAFTEPSALS